MITPSFALTATERVLPRLALNFTTASLDSRITFTRSGNTATVVNSSGLVATVTADTPRFDFDPVALVCKGLLIEEARTNTQLNSQNFSTGWTVSSFATVTANVTTPLAPDGTQSAAKLFMNDGQTVASSRSVFQSNAGLTGIRTASIYAKAGEFSVLRISILSSANTTLTGPDFDLSNGTFGALGSATSATITPAGNGWYRCTATFDFLAGATNVRVYFASTQATGDGSSGIYIWGAQLEAGAFSTSYIPTEASQVTRTADVATMTGTNFSDWYSAGAGGVVARVLPSTVSGTRPALQFDNASADEVIALRGNTTNPELVIVDGGAPQSQINAGTIAANTVYNLGVAWDTDNCAAAVSGGAAVTDTTATIPTVTQARLGSDGTNYLNGQIQTVRYWPQRIINAEVQAFSK